FVVYSTIVQAAGGRSILVPLKKGRHDLETMASKITSSTKLVFIASPNNPTGTINTASEFGRFMERLPEDIIVVVDEAYHEYVTAKDYPDTLQYLKNGRNIIILRTFSKIYGLAGFRIGYGLTKESFVNYMNRVRQPFNTSSLAQRAALFALSDHGHVKESRRINEEGKRFLYKEFKSLCIDYIPTEANFIYIDLKMDSKKIYDRLLKKGVIVRPMGPTQLRITIGLPEENRRFIQTLKEILQKTGRL
ncbi:MAG: aminotransferase class I/II-fold pyridoxal phosphate-dependent enzyme, partial [Nitrospirota bacterium]